MSWIISHAISAVKSETPHLSRSIAGFEQQKVADRRWRAIPVIASLYEAR